MLLFYKMLNIFSSAKYNNYLSTSITEYLDETGNYYNVSRRKYV